MDNELLLGIGTGIVVIMTGISTISVIRTILKSKKQYHNTIGDISLKDRKKNVTKNKTKINDISSIVLTPKNYLYDPYQARTIERDSKKVYHRCFSRDSILHQEEKGQSLYLNRLRENVKKDMTTSYLLLDGERERGSVSEDNLEKQMEERLLKNPQKQIDDYQNFITVIIEAVSKNAESNRIDLERLDLTGINLTKANFTEVNLTEANLLQANLMGINLMRANLTRINFVETDLTGANLTGANLTEANLVKTNLTGANLTEANLTEANLTGTNLMGVNLTRASLEGANLKEVNLEGANLTGANLVEINLIETNLIGANLTRVNLEGANLKGVNLTGANLAEVRLRQFNLEDSDIIKILARAELKEANWDNVTNEQKEKLLLVG